MIFIFVSFSPFLHEFSVSETKERSCLIAIGFRTNWKSNKSWRRNEFIAATIRRLWSLVFYMKPYRVYSLRQKPLSLSVDSKIQDGQYFSFFWFRIFHLIILLSRYNNTIFPIHIEILSLILELWFLLEITNNLYVYLYSYCVIRNYKLSKWWVNVHLIVEEK